MFKLHFAQFSKFSKILRFFVKFHKSFYIFCKTIFLKVKFNLKIVANFHKKSRNSTIFVCVWTFFGIDFFLKTLFEKVIAVARATSPMTFCFFQNVFKIKIKNNLEKFYFLKIFKKSSAAVARTLFKTK